MRIEIYNTTLGYKIMTFTHRNSTIPILETLVNNTRFKPVTVPTERRKIRERLRFEYDGNTYDGKDNLFHMAGGEIEFFKGMIVIVKN